MSSSLTVTLTGRRGDSAHGGGWPQGSMFVHANDSQDQAPALLSKLVVSSDRVPGHGHVVPI
ncbi:hypothetical protein FKP32DRAFT_1587467 [Trametes sanguinea]|nr:hypothetical protein FKP32DRAFT_1587467 [Trametes sanguinea]